MPYISSNIYKVTCMIFIITHHINSAHMFITIPAWGTKAYCMEAYCFIHCLICKADSFLIYQIRRVFAKSAKGTKWTDLVKHRSLVQFTNGNPYNLILWEAMVNFLFTFYCIFWIEDTRKKLFMSPPPFSAVV